MFNVPGRSASAVAELAFGLALSVMRRIPLADRQMRAGQWKKAELEGDELSGKTLGLVGLGAIGSCVARIATGFSMDALAAVARPSDARRTELTSRGITMTDLPSLLTRADVVCVAVPLTDATRDLIAAPQLALMRPHAYLVNVSRGGVVDEHALLAALRAGRLAGAALDVHTRERVSSPFARLDNVVLTPHIGAMSADAQLAIGRIVVDSIVAGLRGAPIPNC